MQLTIGIETYVLDIKGMLGISYLAVDSPKSRPVPFWYTFAEGVDHCSNGSPPPPPSFFP